MTIRDLEGKRVKISAQTITVKDVQGKTRGMIRDARPFRSWTEPERFAHHGTIKHSGLWGRRDSLLDQFILCGGKLYFLNDTKPIHFYERMYAGELGERLKQANPREWEHYKDLLALPELIKEYMPVINCEILSYGGEER